MGYYTKEWDVDTIHTVSGWHCAIYNKNAQQHQTASLAHKKDAVKAMEDWIAVCVKISDPKEVIWNTAQDRTKSYSGSGGYGTTTSYSYVHCDHDPMDQVDRQVDGKVVNNVAFKLIKKDGTELKVIGATKSKIEPWKAKMPTRLVINCSGDKMGTFATYGSSDKSGPLKSCSENAKPILAKMLEKNYEFPPPNWGDELVIDWGDQKAAPVIPQFWFDLHELITQGEFPYEELVFCCFGGHGRTGTALASLALVARTFEGRKVTFKDQPDRVATKAEIAQCYIQHVYCKKAIESKAQVEYIELMGLTLESRDEVEAKKAKKKAVVLN